MMSIVTNAEFQRARENKLYLRVRPILNTANKAAGKVSKYGFKNGNLPQEIACLDEPIKNSLIQDLTWIKKHPSSRFEKSKFDAVNESKLIEFAGIVTHSLILEPLPALEELSKRGILYSDCVHAFADPKTVTTLDISKATLGMATAMHDMIFEYQNSGLSDKHQALLMRRFLPLSYLTYMKNKFKVSPSDMYFFIQTKTFPHVSLDLALKFVQKFQKEFSVSYSHAMFYAKEYVEPEIHLKDAEKDVPSLMSEHNVPKYIARYYRRSYKNHDTALKDANSEISIFAEQYDVPTSYVRYFEKEYENPEKRLIKAIENGEIKRKKYK
jgi:hypothetical protein